MGRSVLGELEHLILIAIVRLEDEAYGAAIIDAIESHTGREMSHAACYIALQRLEGKGLLSGSEAEVGPDRGGRPRRYFALTEEGRRRLQESSRAIFSMWEGVGEAVRGKILG